MMKLALVCFLICAILSRCFRSRARYCWIYGLTSNKFSIAFTGSVSRQALVTLSGERIDEVIPRTDFFSLQPSTRIDQTSEDSTSMDVGKYRTRSLILEKVVASLKSRIKALEEKLSEQELLYQSTVMELEMSREQLVKGVQSLKADLISSKTTSQSLQQELTR